jgi:transglutaminase-like putative cysteine protease
MPTRIELGLKAATIVTVALGYLALLTTPLYGPDLILVPVAGVLAMPLGERLDRRYKAYRRVTTAIIYLYIASFFAIFVRFSFLDAVLSLVMFIQIYLLAHVKQPRHYAYIFLMSFFLLWASATETPRPDIAVVMMLYVLALTCSLTLLEMVQSRAVVSDTHAADARVRFHPRNAAASGRIRMPRARFLFVTLLLGVVSLGFGVGIFMFGPRTDAGVFGATQPRMRPTTGVSSEVDLLSAGALEADVSPLMRVQFPDEPGGQFIGPMLWRVAGLDTYTGSGWQHRGLVTQPNRRRPQPELLRFKSDWRMASREGLDRISDAGWRIVHTEVYLDRPPETAVPALQMVKMIIPRDDSMNYLFRWDIAGDFSVVMTARTNSGVDLEMWSEIIAPTAAELRDTGTDYRSIMDEEDYENLTYQNLLPESLALVRRITENRPTVYDKVTALVAHLNSADYEYTTLIPELPSEHPIDAFILRERRGHCELFASALVLMVRSLGVPARAVSGYRDATWDANDRSYTISNDMAHLWAEVYFPGQGWITFDPSPQGDGELQLADTIARAFSRYMLKARLLWLRYVVGYRPADHQVLFQEATTRIFESAAGAWNSIDDAAPDSRLGGTLRTLAILGVGAGATIVAIYLPWRLRRGRMDRRRPRLTADQRRALHLRRHIVRKFRRFGIHCDGKTAEEISEAVAAMRLNDPADARSLLEVYNGARFGNRAFTPAAYAAWKRTLRRLRLETARG